MLSFQPLLLHNQKRFWAAHKCEASLNLADGLAQKDCNLSFSKNKKMKILAFLIYCAHAIVANPVCIGRD